MREYNALYLDLSRRLKLLRVSLPYSKYLSKVEIETYSTKIDKLLKDLDDKYSNRLPLVDIQAETERLEKIIK